MGKMTLFRTSRTLLPTQLLKIIQNPDSRLRRKTVTFSKPPGEKSKPETIQPTDTHENQGLGTCVVTCERAARAAGNCG